MYYKDTLLLEETENSVLSTSVTLTVTAPQMQVHRTLQNSSALKQCLKGVSPDKRTKFRNVTKFRNISREHCKRIQLSCTRAREIVTHSLVRGVVGAVLQLAVVWGEGGE